jgi:hypothetical protein
MPLASPLKGIPKLDHVCVVNTSGCVQCGRHDRAIACNVPHPKPVSYLVKYHMEQVYPSRSAPNPNIIPRDAERVIFTI